VIFLPRKKIDKSKSDKVVKDTIETSQLSQADRNYVDVFAKELLGVAGSSLMYNPYLQNDVLKDINMNPQSQDYDDVAQLISDPKHNEKSLRRLSQYLYNTIMPIRRVIDYYSKILTWDYVLIPNVEEKELKTTAYKKAENRVYDFLESLDVKKMFTEMMKGAMLEDTKFHYLRESEYGYTFQELPSDYCMITAKNEVSYEYAFDMTYFFRQGTSLEGYPPEFTEYYMDMMNYDRRNGSIKTKDLIVETKNGRWFYWRKLDPLKAFTFKFNSIVSGLTPPLMGLFLDAVNIDQFRNLEKTKTALDAYKLLIGTVPRNKENKSGNKADDFAITAATVARFAAMIKGALPDGVDFKVTPFDKVEAFNFEKSDNKDSITGEALKNFLNNSGSSQVLSINDKPNTSSSKSNQLIDESFVIHMYSIAEGILDLIIKNFVSSKFKMNIKLQGTIFDKEERKKDAQDLASVGFVSIDLMAAARGFNGRQFRRLLASSNAHGFPDKLEPVQSAYHTADPNKKSENGKPKSDDKDLDDSGEISRDNKDE